MIFWLVAAAVTALVLIYVVRALGRGVDAADASFEIQVFRDQLAEVDRDLARGLIDEDSAERTRVEIGRRILAADKAAGGEAAYAQGAGRIGSGVIAVVLAAGFAAYWWLGQPGYDDQPLAARIAALEDARAARPSQAAAEAAITPAPAQDSELADLVVQLRAALAERGDDIQGLTMLTRSELSLGNAPGAREAHERLVALKGAEATTDERAGLIDLMVLATEGYVSPEAEAVALALLADDPGNGFARYYLGLAYAQGGRADLAYGLWFDLIQDSTADAPWAAPVLDELPRVAALAGVRYQPPELRGPSADDLAAARDMSAEDRAAMIEGMVEGLAERLATEGGTAAEWAQLLRALGVLGQHDRAAAIWAEAQQVFGPAPEALELIRAAAIEAGVAQ